MKFYTGGDKIEFKIKYGEIIRNLDNDLSLKRKLKQKAKIEILKLKQDIKDVKRKLLNLNLNDLFLKLSKKENEYIDLKSQEFEIKNKILQAKKELQMKLRGII